ncbi:MAG: hypothetical protein AAFS10_03435, partial [Myxococcota bacterium]
MSAPQIQDEELAQASARAAEVREQSTATPPQEDDYAVFQEESHHVLLLLSDVREVLSPLHVAGIAFPDADLPDELDTLADRSAQLGLGTGVEHLGRLARSLRALLEARGRRQRAPWLRTAWAEMQRLVAWLRMMQTSYDLLQVEGNLVASYSGRIQSTSSSAATASVDVWLFGLTITQDHQAMMYGSDIETGQPVLLNDHFAELHDRDPMRSTAISRLTQGTVVLHNMLNGLVRLTEHPYRHQGRLQVFEPGFKAIARPIPKPRGVQAPKLSELVVDRMGRLGWDDDQAKPDTMDIGWMWAELDGKVEETDVVLCSDDGTPVPMVMTNSLQFNLNKLMLRDGDDRIRLRWVCLVQKGMLYALNTSTGMDGLETHAH